MVGRIRCFRTFAVGVMSLILMVLFSSAAWAAGDPSSSATPTITPSPTPSPTVTPTPTPAPLVNVSGGEALWFIGVIVAAVTLLGVGAVALDARRASKWRDTCHCRYQRRQVLRRGSREVVGAHPRTSWRTGPDSWADRSTHHCPRRFGACRHDNLSCPGCDRSPQDNCDGAAYGACLHRWLLFRGKNRSDNRKRCHSSSRRSSVTSALASAGNHDTEK
jgi:hypothetical protein